MTYQKGKAEKKTKAVHLNLDNDLLEKLKAFADKNERSMVQEIRWAIKKHLGEVE